MMSFASASLSQAALWRHDAPDRTYFPRWSHPNESSPITPPTTKMATIHQNTVAATRCSFAAVFGDALLSTNCQRAVEREAMIRIVHIFELIVAMMRAIAQSS